MVEIIRVRKIEDDGVVKKALIIQMTISLMLIGDARNITQPLIVYEKEKKSLSNQINSRD